VKKYKYIIYVRGNDVMDKQFMNNNVKPNITRSLKNLLLENDKLIKVQKVKKNERIASNRSV